MQGSKRPKRIWIDLDNTPHVPFFVPIIEEWKNVAIPYSLRHEIPVKWWNWLTFIASLAGRLAAIMARTSS